MVRELLDLLSGGPSSNPPTIYEVDLCSVVGIQLGKLPSGLPPTSWELCLSIYIFVSLSTVSTLISTKVLNKSTQ